MFCAGYNPYFFRYAFPLNSDKFSVTPFSCSCILCLFSQHFYGLFYHLTFRDISLKSQETFVYFSVMFHLLLSGFLFCLTFFVEFSFWAIQFVFVYLFGSLYLFIYSDIDIQYSSAYLLVLVPCSLSCLAIRDFFIYLFVTFIILSYLFKLFSYPIYLFISCSFLC